MNPGPAFSFQKGDMDANAKHIIQIVVQGGLVQDVRNVPPGIEVQVIDYDIEGAEAQCVEASPLDGEACCIATY